MMDDYTVVIKLPVKAVSDAGARAAQLEIFHQLQLSMALGIRTDEFVANPVPSEQFAVLTSVTR
jgi:hypothetical protein